MQVKITALDIQESNPLVDISPIQVALNRGRIYNIKVYKHYTYVYYHAKWYVGITPKAAKTLLETWYSKGQCAPTTFSLNIPGVPSRLT